MNEVDENYLFAGTDVQPHKPIQDGFAGGSIGQIHGWSFGVYVCRVWKEEGKWGETLGAQCLNVLRQYEAIRELEALHLTPRRDSRQRTRKRRVCVVFTNINAASFYFMWEWLCSLGILLCELLNGLIPFIDQPATLIMLEKETLIKMFFKRNLTWNLEFISTKCFLSKNKVERKSTNGNGPNNTIGSRLST